MTLLILMLALLGLSIATTYVVREIRHERAKLRGSATGPRDTDEAVPIA
jgi:hypothetical protein